LTDGSTLALSIYEYYTLERYSADRKKKDQTLVCTKSVDKFVKFLHPYMEKLRKAGKIVAPEPEEG
jgi:hypothetical protein